jgi:hypothetical protein
MEMILIERSDNEQPKPAPGTRRLTCGLFQFVHQSLYRVFDLDG